MSGISGIFLRDGKRVSQQQITDLNQKLRHRGPDGSRVIVDDNVALGQQMLHTTSESILEKLPSHDVDDNLYITADARIDNRNELANTLKINFSPQTSDSEFILESYKKWGESCTERLLGDFSFVIWDPQGEQLFCARDHMGVKPFYYHISEDLFLFASEIRPLLSVEAVPRRINKIIVAEFMALKASNRKDTSYDQIYRLPAAHNLIITEDDCELKRYWALDPHRTVELDSDEEYSQAFLNIFQESVRCRLRSTYPVGSMLSGGLDSSSVATMAQKLLNKEKIQLKTFSAYFPSVPESDEQYYIEKVISMSKFKHFPINADEISPLAEVDEFFKHGDLPLILPNTFMNWNIYRKAHKKGVRVLLDGYDGDSTISHGSGYLLELFRSGKWKKLKVELDGYSNRLGLNPYKIFLNLALSTLTPTYFKKLLWQYREHSKANGAITRVLNADFARKIGVIQRGLSDYSKDLEFKDAHSKHYHHLDNGILQYLLEFLDYLAAPFHIEPRHPFFDKRLVEFCLAIPTEQKFSNGWDRIVLRRAMRGILPSKVQWRSKKGDLGPNFYRSLLKFEQLRLDEIIMEKNMIRKYIDLTKLVEMYKRYQSGDSKDVIYIWNAALLQLWISSHNNI